MKFAVSQFYSFIYQFNIQTNRFAHGVPTMWLLLLLRFFSSFKFVVVPIGLGNNITVVTFSLSPNQTNDGPIELSNGSFKLK